MERFLRAGSANSDRGLSGGSVRPQPKMAGMRRADEQTSASEPHSDIQGEGGFGRHQGRKDTDRKSTRLNSSHANISYAVFCLKKNGDAAAGTETAQAAAGPTRPLADTWSELPERSGPVHPQGRRGGGAFFFKEGGPAEFYALSLTDAFRH